MIAVAVIAGDSSSLLAFILNKPSVAKPLANGNASATIGSKRFVPIPSMPRSFARVGKSGATQIPATKSSIGALTRKRRSVIGSNRERAISIGACRIL
jgi:hypothetical protein